MSDAKPGDIGIANHPYLRTGFILLRVVKVGKVMWEVEEYYRNREWCEPCRRKVTGWRPLPADIDPQSVRDWLAERYSQYIDEDREVDRRYRDDVTAFAAALKARESEG